jgi:hypothetical protein
MRAAGAITRQNRRASSPFGVPGQAHREVACHCHELRAKRLAPVEPGVGQWSSWAASGGVIKEGQCVIQLLS